MLAARFVLGPGARQGGAPGGPAGVLLVKITPPESYGEHTPRYPNDEHTPCPIFTHTPYTRMTNRIK